MRKNCDNHRILITAIFQKRKCASSVKANESAKWIYIEEAYLKMLNHELEWHLTFV